MYNCKFSFRQTPLITAADINRMNRERGLEIVAMAGRYEALVVNFVTFFFKTFLTDIFAYKKKKLDQLFDWG